MLYQHGEGRYQQQAIELWKALVPSSGQAATVQGELYRCIRRLESERYRNGNANWDDGFENMAKFLSVHLCDGTFDADLTQQIERDIALVIAAGGHPHNKAYVHKGADSYSRLADRVLEWCQRHPEPVSRLPDPNLKR